MNKNYYKVKCKCGHVGRSFYIPIDFPVIADDAKEAAKIARFIPRCKHHHKDCILNVTKISYEEFVAINENNNKDPYLLCKSVQQQKELDLSDRIISEVGDKPIVTKLESRHKLYSGKIRIRNPKKYSRFYIDGIELCYAL